VYKDEQFLSRAKVAAQVVWHRGILKKGCGLCHGICGNGFDITFLFLMA